MDQPRGHISPRWRTFKTNHRYISPHLEMISQSSQYHRVVSSTTRSFRFSPYHRISVRSFPSFDTCHVMHSCHFCLVSLSVQKVSSPDSVPAHSALRAPSAPRLTADQQQLCDMNSAPSFDEFSFDSCSSSLDVFGRSRIAMFLSSASAAFQDQDSKESSFVATPVLISGSDSNCASSAQSDSVSDQDQSH